MIDFNAALHALARAEHAVTRRAHAGDVGVFETATSCRWSGSPVRLRCLVRVERDGRRISSTKLWAVAVPRRSTRLRLDRTGYVRVGAQALHVTRRG
jgi:hypothetical protein